MKINRYVNGVAVDSNGLRTENVITRQIEDAVNEARKRALAVQTETLKTSGEQRNDTEG